MTDQQLLELAARAAGYEISKSPAGKLWVRFGVTSWVEWKPLEDDGDALRLAVKLGLFVDAYDTEILAGWVVDKDSMSMETLYQPKGNDPYAATRQAIVRAAAEIGKGEQA